MPSVLKGCTVQGVHCKMSTGTVRCCMPLHWLATDETNETKAPNIKAYLSVSGSKLCCKDKRRNSSLLCT